MTPAPALDLTTSLRGDLVPCVQVREPQPLGYTVDTQNPNGIPTGYRNSFWGIHRIHNEKIVRIHTSIGTCNTRAPVPLYRRNMLGADPGGNTDCREKFWHQSEKRTKFPPWNFPSSNTPMCARTDPDSPRLSSATPHVAPRHVHGYPHHQLVDPGTMCVRKQAYSASVRHWGHRLLHIRASRSVVETIFIPHALHRADGVVAWCVIARLWCVCPEGWSVWCSSGRLEGAGGSMRVLGDVGSEHVTSFAAGSYWYCASCWRISTSHQGSIYGRGGGGVHPLPPQWCQRRRRKILVSTNWHQRHQRKFMAEGPEENLPQSLRGPQLVRCGPATVAPAAPAPRPSLLSQFITCSSGPWPCLSSNQFLVPASLAGVRAVGLGSGLYRLGSLHT